MSDDGPSPVSPEPVSPAVGVDAGRSGERGFAAGIAILAGSEVALSAVARVFADCADWPSVAELDARLRAALVALGRAPLEVTFVAAPKPARRRGKPLGLLESLYDARITLERVVPTRPRCWHDFLNALVWATFPRSKAAVHRRQLAMLRERLPAPPHFLPNARTREQDAIAMLDEGGVVLVCAPLAAPRLQRALESKDDDALAALTADGTVTALLFGHALYEHRVAHPDRTVRGYPVLLVLPAGGSTPDLVAAVDAQLAAWLDDRTCLREPHGLRGVLIAAAR